MSDKEKTNGSLAMAPRVITIPAANQETPRKLRVAAYARVSSNSEDQKHSFAAQNAYFSKLITDNPDWELADIYADQGITGTSIDKREDFQRMMEDCRKGAHRPHPCEVILTLCPQHQRESGGGAGISCAGRQRLLRGTEHRHRAGIRRSSYRHVRGTGPAEERGYLRTRAVELQSPNEKGRFSTCKAPYGYRLVKDH